MTNKLNQTTLAPLFFMECRKSLKTYGKALKKSVKIILLAFYFDSCLEVPSVVALKILVYP